MSIDYVLTMWVCYCAQMNGRPKPTVNSCQKVLHYLLQEVKLVVRSWRKRQQHYSSASIFKRVGTDLKHWVFGDPVSPTDEAAVRQRRKRVFETHIICISKPTFTFRMKYTSSQWEKTEHTFFFHPNTRKKTYDKMFFKFFHPIR